MADSKISELSNATSLTDNDVLAGVNMSGDTGTTRKFMLSRIREYFKVTFDGLYAATSHDHSYLSNGTYQAAMPTDMKKNGTVALKTDLVGTSIGYDNTSSGMQAETVQAAIDELATRSGDTDDALQELTEEVTAQGKTLSDHITATDNPHKVTAAQIGAIPTTDKGTAGGVATLSDEGVVPDSQLPDYVSSITVENMTVKVTIKS